MIFRPPVCSDGDSFTIAGPNAIDPFGRISHRDALWTVTGTSEIAAEYCELDCEVAAGWFRCIVWDRFRFEGGDCVRSSPDL